MSADPDGLAAADADDMDLDDDLMAAIAAAEAAVGEMASDYPEMLRQDVMLLEQATHKLRLHARGTEDHTKACVDAFGVLHDIKGQAASFGFEAATALCDPLCECVRGHSEVAPHILDLIEAAVGLLNRMVSEGATADLESAAYVLLKKVPQTS
ncbi:MAG: Hpt domain-containing protein [Candidatus Phaeomarinobacter sp.]